MHISLDSELGQQRRLNQIGETITSIAAPAAAYSLRSLTGGDPKAVRVRRDSDDTERDFTVSEVNSGAMVDFVNTQTVKPLDVRARNTGTGERDGLFQIAKAAYSLRSLGDRQATVSATGDTVAADNGKYVVQVRRKVDDTIKSFTADEVTDGTLLSFVNQIQTVGTAVNGTGSFNNYTVTGESTTGFSADNSAGGTGSAGFPYVFKDEDVIVVRYTVTNFNSTSGLSPSLRGTNAINNVSSLTTGETPFTANGTYTETLTATADGTHLMFADADTGSYTISNFEIVSHLSEGFVRTWYDQSVTDQGGGTATGNHATQSTPANQPKIVTNGALLVDSAGLPEIDFDGTHKLDIDFGADLDQPNSIFMVHQSDGTSANSNEFFDSTGTGGVRSVFDQGSTNYRLINHTTSPSTNVTFEASGSDFAIDTNKNIAVGIFNGSSSLIAKNGTSTTGSTSAVNGQNEINRLSTIGLSAPNSNNGYDGTMQEFIVYNSDQTNNRGAYEGNMADHYSITGVPTGNNTVNGFVTKWYDQSGNNRPLIQTTATEQPFIVESGTFLNGVKSNKASSNDTMQNLQVSTDGTTANFGTDDWASGASSKLGLIYVGSVPHALIFKTDSEAVIWGGGRAVNNFQSGGLSLQVIKAGNDSWKLMNEREGLDPERTASTLQTSAQNTDGDVIWYGIADNRDFTVNVNGAGNTDTESADLDVRENAALSLFGSYGGDGTPYYQRSGGGVCKECYLYAGTSITNIPTIATKINEHYSIYT
tara:strand:+ start:243 stop:2528 length:2286 start_codon:yes stop_codon:yes gene_type:complete